MINSAVPGSGNKYLEYLTFWTGGACQLPITFVLFFPPCGVSELLASKKWHLELGQRKIVQCAGIAVLLGSACFWNGTDPSCSACLFSLQLLLPLFADGDVIFIVFLLAIVCGILGCRHSGEGLGVLTSHLGLQDADSLEHRVQITLELSQVLRVDLN